MVYHILSYSVGSIFYHFIYGCVFCTLLFNFVNYVFFLLPMFRSVYSVSLCCSVYCLCVNVYCTAATRCQARDFWRREKTKNTRGRQQITVCLSVYICVYVCPSLSLYIYIFFFLSLSIFLSLSVTGADLKTNGHILGDCCIALCFLLCNSPESEFYIPTFQNSVCSILIPTSL